MSDPKDKLENGVYVLKSAARHWLAIQIGDIVDPITKARKGWDKFICSTNFWIWSPFCLYIVTVEQIDENNKAQHVCFFILLRSYSYLHSISNIVAVDLWAHWQSRIWFLHPRITRWGPYGLLSSWCQEYASPNWATDRIWTGGPGPRMTLPELGM